MTALSRFMACAAVFCLGTAAQAVADPIQVTAGSVTALGGGIAPPPRAPTAIVGTKGFSLTGLAHANEGRMDIFGGCDDCPPGFITPASTQSIGAVIDTFEATATFDGMTYAIDPGIDTPNHVFMELTGSAVFPSFTERHLIVTAPFAMNFGSFFSQSGPISEGLRGQGIAMLLLSPVHLPQDLGDAWRVDQIRYDFNASAVTPEPASLILIGIGVAMCGLRRALGSHA